MNTAFPFSVTWASKVSQTTSPQATTLPIPNFKFLLAEFRREFNALFIGSSSEEDGLLDWNRSFFIGSVFNFSIKSKWLCTDTFYEFTYLGIVFDERLSWGSHVSKVISKAGKCVDRLGHLRDNLTHSANVVYISLIRPILKDCDTLWGCCGEGNSKALESLQKRAGRIVAKMSCSSPEMDILKWPAPAERRHEHVFQLVKKCIEGRCPQYFDGYFTFNTRVLNYTILDAFHWCGVTSCRSDTYKLRLIGPRMDPGGTPCWDNWYEDFLSSYPNFTMVAQKDIVSKAFEKSANTISVTSFLFMA